MRRQAAERGAAAEVYEELDLEVRASPIQGLGVFARRRIPRGTRVIEYTGERISPREAAARYVDEQMARHHTLLFSVDARTLVDAAVGGNAARFINHSCEPNCEAVIVGGRIYIDALRAIAPGEELTYDYGYERDGTEDAAAERRYGCRCGAPGCRGTILKPAPPAAASDRAPRGRTRPAPCRAARKRRGQ